MMTKPASPYSMRVNVSTNKVEMNVDKKNVEQEGVKCLKN